MGIDNRNEKSAASVCDIPHNCPATIVQPLRVKPGNTADTHGRWVGRRLMMVGNNNTTPATIKVNGNAANVNKLSNHGLVINTNAQVTTVATNSRQFSRCHG